MKIAIFDPYLNILGGGERYISSIAECLNIDNSVDLYAGDKSIKQKISNQFNINLPEVLLLPDDVFHRRGILRKLRILKKYDRFFYMTDGSLFFSSAAKNYLIIQSPAHIPPKDLINKLKLHNWQILCYSQFVSEIIKTKLGLNSFILPPAIEDINYKNSTKENIILTVGRFFLYPHNKKQDILIDIFKKNYKSKFKDYKLILVGGLTEESGKQYLNSLKEKAKGLPIEFYINPSFDKLHYLYSIAKFYWHAAGFAEDLYKFPERAEHFGITTLEAMNAGCVPLVFNGGGQKEIVGHNKDGFLWETERELADLTFNLIKDETKRSKIAEKSIIKSKEYSKSKFYEKLQKIIF